MRRPRGTLGLLSVFALALAFAQLVPGCRHDLRSADGGHDGRASDGPTTGSDTAGRRDAGGDTDASSAADAGADLLGTLDSATCTGVSVVSQPGPCSWPRLRLFGFGICSAGQTLEASIPSGGSWKTRCTKSTPPSTLVCVEGIAPPRVVGPQTFTGSSTVVQCKTTEVVGGGGCDCVGVSLVASHPQGEREWRCACASTPKSTPHTAYALCLPRDQSTCVYRKGPSIGAPNTVKLVCNGSDIAIAGGCQVSGTARLTGSERGATSWRCDASTGGDVSTWVICAAR